MNNLIRKVPRITYSLTYLFVAVWIISILIKIQHWPYAYHANLLSMVLAVLLIISMSIEIMLSQEKLGKKLSWLSSIILPQLIALIYVPELWLLAIGLSAFVFAKVIRKKLYRQV